jgi:hypothetical protein
VIGGHVLRKRFRPRSKIAALRRWAMAGAAMCALLALFELYQIIVPFRSANPLWQEVTIGQPVIDGWAYGGEDAEGYLKFYNQSETVLLPPSSHMFDADGKFVVIEGHTPSTLTYAEPYEAIPLPWLLAGCAAMMLGGIWLYRIRRSWFVRWGTNKPRWRVGVHRAVGKRGRFRPRTSRRL